MLSFGDAMNTNVSPRQLALDLCSRSPCRTKMAAVIYDKWGIFSWGWNHPGEDGLGEHAEVHAIKRANPKRLKGAGIVVAGLKPSGKGLVVSLPCVACRAYIRAVGIDRVAWFDGTRWKQERIT